MKECVPLFVTVDDLVWGKSFLIYLTQDNLSYEFQNLHSHH